MTRPEDLSREGLPDSQAQFQRQVLRLHQVKTYGRWLFVGSLWLLVAPLCLWHLRFEMGLWFDYFTWTAVRYTIIYNRFASLGLILCVAWTVSVLVWQSRNILQGIPADEWRSLEKQVLRIRQRGKSHPLWKWVCKP